MSDEGAALLREVEEEERREQMEALWKKWGSTIVTVAVLAVAGVAGGVWYQTSEIERAQLSTQRIVSIPDGALGAAGDSPTDVQIAAERADLYAKLLPSVAGERAALVQMLRASSLVQAGEKKQGAELFLATADNPLLPDYMRRAALIQAASAGIGHVDADLLVRRLQPLANGTDRWSLIAMELTALAELQRPDGAGVENAKKLLEEVSLSAEVGSITRNRATELLRGLGQ